MAFLHSLVKVSTDKQTGWYVPQELGEATPHYVTFAIPTHDRTGTFDDYACEVVMFYGRKKPHVLTYTLVNNGKGVFLLDVDGLRIWFHVRKTAGGRNEHPYLGKLRHADFAL